MAGGHGPAPKDASQRRNRIPKARGEWVDLPDVAHDVPKPDKGWPPRTKACWSSWWKDPASTQWTEADRTYVLELAHLHADMVFGRQNLHAEIRQRMDGLGLTQKGKRDLRWRVGGPPVEPSSLVVLTDYRAMVSGE